ncbi:monovalent cation/H+ antiporter subunit E [Corynebacterium cystitidis]|uniref:Multisubunit sodium/proton antiporter, MrpE subunit n=1 Tax=Corynebacterium cystitidis DSM 20524 TaxID=1121357 RepID=A0A1H9U9M2_9CORY|nr:monovalent cation/H+ antiporter subunit E [Corynebacterium cystitidis]WJY81244.1 putative monovalent cation/H+ antiporter subunit E [Corynebacterium cystitidis DSM 20524]SES06049.1 multisubunit sodium/proton antiporter, MrpE subunit [Corynebacterium cystitidis DSM 20524]SNV89003.1 monovalent cation/H+ antiporter subunit E [Corynebacterium cystitidis]
MHVISYIFWLIKEIFVAGFGAAWKGLKPTNELNPVVIYYPLRVTGEWEIFWFASSVTATPTTLSLGLREPVNEGEPRILIVQSAFGSDPVSDIESFADMEERLAPGVKDIPFDATKVYYEYPAEDITASGKEV